MKNLRITGAGRERAEQIEKLLELSLSPWQRRVLAFSLTQDEDEDDPEPSEPVALKPPPPSGCWGTYDVPGSAAPSSCQLPFDHAGPHGPGPKEAAS